MTLTNHQLQSSNLNGRSSERPVVVLTIGGSDPTGGAGIQADLKTFQHFGVHGLSAITAVTVQNTSGVLSTNPLSAELVQAQLATLANDIKFDAIKIGMLTTAEVVRVVAEFISAQHVPTVLDPIIASSNAVRFMDDDAIQILKDNLLPIATIITPNIPESEVFTGLKMETEDSIIHASLLLHDMGAKAMLIKGGHANSEESRDLFYDGLGIEWLSSPRIAKHVHGTGCVLSSAIASCLANGMSLRNSVIEAKKFITSMLEQAIPLGSGQEIFQYPPFFVDTLLVD
jgi:hydroxymethylpyrimidine/phosphomethylpyrimidine kinase